MLITGGPNLREESGLYLFMYRPQYASFGVKEGQKRLHTVIRTIGSVHKGTEDHRPVTETLTMVIGSASRAATFKAGKRELENIPCKSPLFKMAYLAMLS